VGDIFTFIFMHMNYIKKYSPKAEVCSGNTRITVYGEMADIINGITAIMIIIAAISFIAKLLE
jgi:hypothetical protein